MSHFIALCQFLIKCPHPRKVVIEQAVTNPYTPNAGADNRPSWVAMTNSGLSIFFSNASRAVGLSSQ